MICTGAELKDKIKDVLVKVQQLFQRQCKSLNMRQQVMHLCCIHIEKKQCKDMWRLE